MTSLAVPYTGITVCVPVGILDHQKPARREAIVEAIRSWIETNRLYLCDGEQKYMCDVPGGSPVTLTVHRRKCGLPQGLVSIGRQQVTNDLDKVIENALGEKLPKLVKTEAHRHVLFLERERFNFFPELIFSEIERQRSKFPLLNKVDDLARRDDQFLPHLPAYRRRGDVTAGRGRSDLRGFAQVAFGCRPGDAQGSGDIGRLRALLGHSLRLPPTSVSLNTADGNTHSAVLLECESLFWDSYRWRKMSAMRSVEGMKRSAFLLLPCMMWIACSDHRMCSRRSRAISSGRGPESSMITMKS